MRSIKILTSITVVCLLRASSAKADDPLHQTQGYGTGYASVQSTEQSAAQKAHMRRNADLYNKQLIKLWNHNGTKGGVTRISFVADHVGNMFDLQVMDSCGKESVDNSALKAVGAMVPMKDFGGEADMNYLFKSTFDGEDVKTEFLGVRTFVTNLDDRLLRRPSGLR